MRETTVGSGGVAFSRVARKWRRKWNREEARKREWKWRNLLPDILLPEQAGNVASPVTSGPACTLLQKPGIVLEGCLHLCLWMVLQIRFPAVRHHPASDEIVIVRVQLVSSKPPPLIREGVCENLVLQDLAAVRDSASRQASDTAVHVRCGGTVKIPPFQVECTQVSPHTLRQGWRCCSPQALAGNHPAEFLILLEGREHPAQGVPRPGHIVVCEDNDLGTDLWDCSRHLASLVGVDDGHQADSLFGRRHSFQHFLRVLFVCFDGHQHELERLVFEDCSNRLNQFVSTALQRGENDSDILRGQCWVVWWVDRSKCVESYQIDNETQVTVDTGLQYVSSREILLLGGGNRISGRRDMSIDWRCILTRGW